MSVDNAVVMAFGLDARRRIAPDPWRERAACRTCPADLFFPIGTTGSAVTEIAAAKEICGLCEVRSDCLEYALQTNQEFGIWGGIDEEERRRFRKHHLRSGPRGHPPIGMVAPPATPGR